MHQQLLVSLTLTETETVHFLCFVCMRVRLYTIWVNLMQTMYLKSNADHMTHKPQQRTAHTAEYNKQLPCYCSIADHHSGLKAMVQIADSLSRDSAVQVYELIVILRSEALMPAQFVGDIELALVHAGGVQLFSKLLCPSFGPKDEKLAAKGM